MDTHTPKLWSIVPVLLESRVLATIASGQPDNPFSPSDDEICTTPAIAGRNVQKRRVKPQVNLYATAGLAACTNFI